jgi:hypothetical protein
MRSLMGVTATMLLAACATIMHGSRQEVGISSSPTGARVMVDNRQLGVTPVVAKLSRKNNHIVRIEMDGFQPYETTLTKKVSGWVWGNLVFGGIIGLVVDAATGGLYNLTPEQVQASMTKTAWLPQKGDVYIAVVLQADPNWQKIAQLEKQ